VCTWRIGSTWTEIYRFCLLENLSGVLEILMLSRGGWAVLQSSGNREPKWPVPVSFNSSWVPWIPPIKSFCSQGPVTLSLGWDRKLWRSPHCLQDHRSLAWWPGADFLLAILILSKVACKQAWYNPQRVLFAFPCLRTEIYKTHFFVIYKWLECWAQALVFWGGDSC
jgi:hypothetical protein